MRTIIRYPNGGLLDGDKHVPIDPANSDYQRIMREVADGKAEIVPTNVPPKSVQEAIAEGDAYITAQGFGQMERQELTALMAAGMLNEAQMEKVRAVLSWIMSLKAQAVSDPINFNPSTNPPFQPSEILQ